MTVTMKQNAPMSDEKLQECLTMVQSALDEVKAQNITVLNVRELTDVMEYMVIAEGTSKRHVSALADKVGEISKKNGFMPLGREGEKDSDWTLVDLGGVVVHIMTSQARGFYDLEGLWSSPEELRKLTARALEDR